MGWGIFLMYAVLTYFGAGFVWLCLPETKVSLIESALLMAVALIRLQGRSIESMDDLFRHPLWMMWKHAYPKEEDKVRRDVQEQYLDTKVAESEDGDEKRTSAMVTKEVEKA